MVISLQHGQVVPSNVFESRIWRAHKTIILVICFLWADLFEDDARSFHAFYKAICDKYSSSLYRDSKQACDAYFYIPARKEHRGTGGIFFDDLETFQCQVTIASFHSSHRCSLLWGLFKHLYLIWIKILTRFCLHDKHLHELEVMSLCWVYVVSCRMKAALKILAPVLFSNLWKMLQRASCQAICPLQIQGGRCVMGREKGNGNYSAVDDIWNLTCYMIGVWNLGWMAAE